MSGYHTILKCEKIKERADKLGFVLCSPKHGWMSSQAVDYVAIKPKPGCLPIYSRDAELFCGTIDDLNAFFTGLEWARDYDRMLKVSSDAKRERKEQDELNRQLVSLLKDEKVSGIMT